MVVDASSTGVIVMLAFDKLDLIFATELEFLP